MKIEEENTTIKVRKGTRTDLMLFKIYAKAKNMDETIQELLTLAKRRTSSDGTTIGDVFNTLYKKREVKK
jgi:hypothetical protein